MSMYCQADRYSDELEDLRDQLVKLREKTEKEKRAMFDEIQIMEADRYCSGRVIW